MRKTFDLRLGFFNLRALVGFALCFLAVVFVLFAIDVPPDQSIAPQIVTQVQALTQRNPQQLSAIRAAHSFRGDLRILAYIPPVREERTEIEPPPFVPRLYQPLGTSSSTTAAPTISPGPASVSTSPAPAPLVTFDGLDYAAWGAGHPPDPNGDVGPTYYIQVVNTSLGVYRKSDGVRVAAFTFNSFMSQGQFGNLCDTNNFGDPVVLYDTFEDRWIITDFAFKHDQSGNILNPPGVYQCFAASKSGDPVTGGWNYYSIFVQGGIDDYPKFGIWPDGLYMSANIFSYTSSYENPRVWAFNKSQMYAGASNIQILSFDAPSNDFTLLPSDARLQTGTPPSGSPNYFIGTYEYLNALTVYKFHVDWGQPSLSTFTGPEITATGSSYPNQLVGTAATPAASLDTLGLRAMARNQYANNNGAESLWVTHTVRRDTNGFATPRWYQVDVTGGTPAANTLQTATWDPDGANLIYRYVPSLAVDRMGDLAIGYTTSNSTTNPGIMYAGRLVTDPVNTFSQTEQVLFQGSGTQSCNTGGCSRWGDYTSMTLDPADGCTFWYTNEYYAVNGLKDLTRIGAFRYAQCLQVGDGGTISGQVTDARSINPISGATVMLGSGRTMTTDLNGQYSFVSIPAGAYPNMTANAPGYNSDTKTNVVVSDSTTTTENFVLAAATPTPTPTSTPIPSPTPTPTPTPMVQVTVQTNLAGLSFTVDGTTYGSVQTFSWQSGSNHTIATTSPQSGGPGIQYTWTNWSDGGSISHSVAPTKNMTYTAKFSTQYYLTMNTGTGGTVSPSSGWRNGGTIVSIKATPTNNTQVSYSFNGWTGSGTGSYSGTNSPASITMSGPLTETASFTQNPVQVTVQTNQSGGSFTVDGTSYTSGQTFSWQPGSSHTIATSSPQSGGAGVQYAWTNWSDSGAISHTVAPATNKTYTAKFNTQYYLTMSAGTGGKVSPASGWQKIGSVVKITATPSTGYSFSGWTGNGTGSFSGTANPSSITMGGPITETAAFTHN